MHYNNNDDHQDTSKWLPTNESFSLHDSANKGGTPPPPQATKIKEEGK